MSQAFCISCGTAIAEGTQFCPHCGTPVSAGAPAQPTPPQPPYVPQPPYGQPPYYVTVRPVRPGRGFGITSMVLGIIGIVYSFILFVAAASTASQFRFASVGLAAGSLVYSVFGILALVFGVLSRNRGYRCGVSLSGVVLGGLSIGFCLLACLIFALA